MTKLSFEAWLIVTLNRLFPRTNEALVEARIESRTFSEFEYQRARRQSADFSPPLDFTDMHVLDIGCGFGGFPTFYIQQKRARAVTTIDLQVPHLRAARRFARSVTAPRVINFVSCDATRLPFADNFFDAVISTNTFEHIFGIEEALSEGARVVKPGGRIFISYPPYESPWGSHLNNWLRIPWCSALFSERALIQACNYLEERERLNEKFPPILRLDLSYVIKLTHVNQIKIAEFQTALERVQREHDLEIIQELLLPIGGRFKNGTLRKLFAPLTKIRALQDMFTTQVVYVMKKRAAQG